MIIFRLGKLKYSRDLSGKGAEKSGGRWNSKRTAIVYTSASRALCTIEIAVHTPLGNIPLDYSLTIIEIPDDIAILEVKKLPADWQSVPHADSTQKIGDAFISENKFAVLKVPSAVVQDEYNFLLNPYHKDISRIKIRNVELFTFDERLFIK